MKARTNSDPVDEGKVVDLLLYIKVFSKHKLSLFCNKKDFHKKKFI